MEQTSVNLEALPSFFRDVKIVGPAHLELPKYRAMHANLAVSSLPKNCEISANQSPIFLMSKAVRETYQSNNFAKIKDLEAHARNDLQAVYQNVSANGPKAWTKVRKDDKEFYMSWSQTGCMWAYTESTSNSRTDNGDSHQAVVQVGTYTKSSGIVGIQSYNLTFPTIIAQSAIAFIVALGVSNIIADNLGFLVANFALYLAQAAAAIGFDSFSFVIPVAVLSNLAVALVFAIVFIGLIYLWNWLNRKYSIRMQVFNWDDKNSWNAAGQYLSNAKIPGGGQELTFTLPKMLKPSDVVTPPGFKPVEVLDSVCYYAVIIRENDNTFAEGCSMAIRMQKNGTDEGFMWAFDCPRFSDNKQAGDGRAQDPKTYLDICRSYDEWSNTPKGFQIESTSAKIPVSFALDALSGASDDLYNVNMHINKPKT